ncbi:MAG: type III pantothenate kinase [Chthoniobacterales bacterium]
MFLADAGNSSVKLAVIPRAGGAPRALATIARGELSAARVRTWWKKSQASTAAGACVVPAMAAILRTGCPAIHLIDARSPLNFSTRVDRSTVGADRLANMAEAARLHGRSVVVADFGTAATFDLLDRRGCFAGGAIAPGLRLLASTLSTGTAGLPLVAAGTPPRNLLGTNTHEALRAGVVGGYVGMTTHLLDVLAEGGKKVIFTGGDGALIARLSGRRVTVDPLWTLKGIAVLGALAAREGSK